MDLRHLEHFVAVAEEHHFTRAAARCYVSQSALSHSITALERELGATLFTRSSRRVVVTPAGHALLPEARRTLAAAQAARDAVDRMRGRVAGNISVGQVVGAVGGWIGEYHRRHPDVQVSLEESGSASLLESVRDGRLDVAFSTIGPTLPAGVVVVDRHTVALGLACSTDHPLARRTSVTADELRDEILVLVSHDHPARLATDEVLAGVHVNESMVRPRDPHSALDLVADGIGLSLMPKTWVAARSDVHWLELADARPNLVLGVVIADRPQPLAVSALLDMLQVAPPSSDDETESEPPRA